MNNWIKIFQGQTYEGTLRGGSILRKHLLLFFSKYSRWKKKDVAYPQLYCEGNKVKFNLKILNYLNLRWLVFLLLLITFYQCADDEEESYVPKPRGYYRIQFPEKKYRKYDSVCPFKFEYPVYGKIEKDPHPLAEPCWINVQFPYFKATLHISYKDLKDKNVANLIEDSRDLAIKHQIKSTGMEETVILRDSVKVYGLVYDIEGNTASSLQFYITDSTHHFIRGALYFNVRPNIDSVKIVLQFLRNDVIHLIQTLEWDKNNPKK